MRAFMTVPVRAGTRVEATYSPPLDGFGVKELEDEKKRLTLQARTSFGAPCLPSSHGLSRMTACTYPRFYGIERYGQAETDMRVYGEQAITLTFEGTLTDVQQRATDVIFDRYLLPSGDGGALVCLPCGYGKTVGSECHREAWTEGMHSRAQVVPEGSVGEGIPIILSRCSCGIHTM